VSTAASIREQLINDVTTMDNGEKLTKIMTDMNKEDRAGALKDLNINKNLISYLSSIDDMDKESKDMIIRALADIADGAGRNGKEITNAISLMSDGQFTSSQTAEELTDKQIEDSKNQAKQTADAVVTLTTPIDKLGDIVKSGAQYKVSSLWFLKAISEGVSMLAEIASLGLYKNPLEKAFDDLQKKMVAQGEGFEKTQFGMNELLKRKKAYEAIQEKRKLTP
jgi:hypothetical protein